MARIYSRFSANASFRTVSQLDDLDLHRWAPFTVRNVEKHSAMTESRPPIDRFILEQQFIYLLK